MVKLLIVTGSGRSGTSSVAGTLKRFGFHIPQPEVQTDEKNPRGYYEPSWSAIFHKRWLESLPVRTIDTRPRAGEVAMASLTPELHQRLHDWVADEVAARAAEAGDDAVLLVKETRAYFVYPLWQRVAAEVGTELTSLTMLRHPTQVVRSRDSAYLSGRPDEVRLTRETANVAAWMNSIFITERATRDNRRAFVPYYDLISDWRAAMTRACGQLGLDTGDLSGAHDVDDFITPSLNRSSDAWDGLTVPDGLRAMAEATWAAAHALVATPDDAAAMAELDRLREEYAGLHAASAAIATDDIEAEAMRVRRQLEERLAVKNERIEKLRSDRDTRLGRKNATIAELRAELAALRGPSGPS